MYPPLGFARADTACSLEAARFFTSIGLNGQAVVGLYVPRCAQFLGSLGLFNHLRADFSTALTGWHDSVSFLGGSAAHHSLRFDGQPFPGLSRAV